MPSTGCCTNEERFYPPSHITAFVDLRPHFPFTPCCIALCKPAATELKSKNAHGVSLMQRSLFTDPFFDFFFLIYILIFFDFDCTLTGQGGL